MPGVRVRRGARGFASAPVRVHCPRGFSRTPESGISFGRQPASVCRSPAIVCRPRGQHPIGVILSEMAASSPSVPFLGTGRHAVEESLSVLLLRHETTIADGRSNPPIAELFASIKAIFLALNHPLICFSRAMALLAPPCASNHTSFLTLYFRVNPGFSFRLCCHIRRSKLAVTPVYKTPDWLERMYTWNILVTDLLRHAATPQSTGLWSESELAR